MSEKLEHPCLAPTVTTRSKPSFSSHILAVVNLSRTVSEPPDPVCMLYFSVLSARFTL